MKTVITPWQPILLSLLLSLTALAQTGATPKWQQFETSFQSGKDYPNPPQQAILKVTFTSANGQDFTVPGFWDGGRTWRVRFAPGQTGAWKFKTTCSDPSNEGLHQQSGTFSCSEPVGQTRFAQHGPIRVARDGRYLIHDDGTPFLFLADTAWNGPLLSTDEEWQTYLTTRKEQAFTAVQFVTTQWRAAPNGDRTGQPAFEGTKEIKINPEFFQRLDKKVQATADAGLLNVPVLLWAISGGANPRVNPGHILPTDQAIVLARYMIARWQAHPNLWFLGGDADYRGDKAERWNQIGRALFNSISHAPVTMHPGGMQWVWNEFVDEKWYDVVAYQSGHGDNDDTLRWIFDGPSTKDWYKLPHRPFINVEPPYENHVAYHSKKPHSDTSVRRALYWSLLCAPTAGVSYGGHGVWGWDDGSGPPTDHNGSGTPMPWEQALRMPGAEQIKHLHKFFTSFDFWRLRPAPYAVADQPGKKEPGRYIAAARSDEADLLVIYTPEDRTLTIKLDTLPPSPKVTWINPRTGEESPAVAVVTSNTCQFPTPGEGDWILFMKTEIKKEESKPEPSGPASPAEN